MHPGTPKNIPFDTFWAPKLFLEPLRKGGRGFKHNFQNDAALVSKTCGKGPRRIRTDPNMIPKSCKNQFIFPAQSSNFWP